MREVVITGIPCFQRNKLLISGAIRAKDLIKIHQVDEWKMGKAIEVQGCQRPPIRSHYQRIGKKLKDDVRATLPTSITLSAVDGSKDPVNLNAVHFTIDSKTQVAKITIPQDKKVKVVDGQHRVLGLQFAIDELKQYELENFMIPFVLTIVEDRIEEIRNFYEINTTGKRVSTDLALQLLNDWNAYAPNARLTKAEQWKIVALNIAMELNNNRDSVWFRCIGMGNSKKGSLLLSAAFVNSLHDFLMNISFVREVWMGTDDLVGAGKRIAGLVNNYWKGLALAMPECFPGTREEKADWYIQKFAGAHIWHMAAAFILEECLVTRMKITDLTAENIGNFLKQYGGFGIDDAEVMWEGEGGEASRARGRKDYADLVRTIKDDIHANWQGKSAVNI